MDDDFDDDLGYLRTHISKFFSDRKREDYLEQFFTSFENASEKSKLSSVI